jgi:hypothetical protein
MKKKTAGKSGIVDSSEHHWKRRPSEIRGYTRTLYMTDDNGDYLRVDYNTKEKRVRLYLEDASEGGIPYYAVIAGGRITAEKNAQTGRPVSLSEKFGLRAELFGSIGNREVLKLINENYGIGAKGDAQRSAERRQILERTRKRYFRPDEYGARSRREAIKQFFRLQLIDVIDMLIGAMVVAGVYLYLYDFYYSGIISACFGIVFGAIDIFLRKRDPFFPKIVAFLIAGAWLYFYGYYYR